MMARTRQWFGGVAVGLVMLVGALGTGWAQDKPEAAVLEEAERLNVQVLKLHREGNYDAAIPLAERALAIFEKALGPNHPDVALLLNNLAELYREKGDYGPAEPLYNRALAIVEHAVGPEHPQVALFLNNLALLFHMTGDYARAAPLYERALAIFEKALGPDDPTVAHSLNNVAEIYEEKGDYGRARPCYERALTIFENLLGPDDPAVATAVNNLALNFKATGDYPHAEPLLQRALTIRENALGADHPLVAQSFNNLATLYATKGDYARAETLLQRALATHEKARFEDPAVATRLNNLAVLYRDKGDYARAEPLLLHALGIQERTLGKDHPDVATSLNNLALLYRAKGDYTRAAPHLVRALGIQQKVLGNDHPHLARSLNNLALLYHATGDYVQAEPLFQRAFVILEKALGKDHPDAAQCLNNLAELYKEKGDYARAEPLYLQVLRVQENALGKDHPHVAQSLNNLAMLYGAKGDYEGAERLHLDALAIREKALGAHHPDVAQSLINLALLHWAQNDVNRALRALEQGVSIEDRNAARELAVGADEQRRAYMWELGARTEASISFHIQFAAQLENAKRLALRTILRRKGVVLDAMANSLANLREKLLPKDKEKFDTWCSLNAQYSTLVQRGSDEKSRDEFPKRLKQIDDERQAIENVLSHVSKDLQIQLQSVSIEQVQAALPRGSALVELYRYQPFNPKEERLEKRWGTPRFVAYILHANGQIDFADLGKAKPIEDAATALREDLSRIATDPKSRNAQLLHHLVMAPIQKLLGNSRHIYLSPDGELNLVPLEALVDETDHYVVESYAITYLPSARDLVRRGDAVPSRNAAIVFAGPDYDFGPKRETPPDHSFDPLLLATDEAAAIATSMPGTTLRAGAEATEAAVKALRAPRFLHIATHGFFAANVAALHASPDKKVPWFENPLSKSGLAFAGANRSAAGENDGLLTALEASQLDLYGTKLVVLSACNTGNGKVENGDSVYGLRRAFGIAGAETIVMSLWKVEGSATTALMKSYYEGLSTGGGRAESLRQAQLGMLQSRDRSHPYYWASFIMSGDDRSMEGQVVEPMFGKLSPGLRGCACEIGAHETNQHGVWLGIVAVGAAMMLRRLGLNAENAR